jgi:hypothetical protein
MSECLKPLLYRICHYCICYHGGMCCSLAFHEHDSVACTGFWSVKALRPKEASK